MARKRPWNGRTSGANIQNVRVYLCNKCGAWHNVKAPAQCMACGCIAFTHFHSKAEAKRYGELALELKHGFISGLQMQTPFVLNAVRFMKTECGTAYHAVVKIGKYVSDFDYVRKGVYVVEDVKGGDPKRGVDTDTSAWKRKHAEAEHGITITIVRR